MPLTVESGDFMSCAADDFCKVPWADELSFILCLLENANITVGFQIILSSLSIVQSLYFFTIRQISRWVSFLCSFVQWFHSFEILRVEFHILHNFHFLCFLNHLSECLQLETGGQLSKHLPIQPPNQVTNLPASQQSNKPTFRPSIHPTNQPLNFNHIIYSHLSFFCITRINFEMSWIWPEVSVPSVVVCRKCIISFDVQEKIMISALNLGRCRCWLIKQLPRECHFWKHSRLQQLRRDSWLHLDSWFFSSSVE